MTPQGRPDCNQLYREAKAALDAAGEARATYIRYVEQFRPDDIGHLKTMTKAQEAEVARLAAACTSAEKIMAITQHKWLSVCHGMVDDPWEAMGL